MATRQPSKWVAVRHRRPRRPRPPPLVRSPLHSNLTFQFPKYPTSQLPIGYGPTQRKQDQPANRPTLPTCQPSGTCELESQPTNNQKKKYPRVSTTWPKVSKSVQNINDLAKRCPKVSKISTTWPKGVQRCPKVSTTWPKGVQDINDLTNKVSKFQ